MPRLSADLWFETPSRERQIHRTRLLVRRSSLILPVHVPRFVERAYARGADAIVLDLEDSVPSPEKSGARALVRKSLELAGRGGADVLVRINKPFEAAILDLDASVWPGLSGIVFPKVESPAEVQALDCLLAERESARGMTVGEVDIAVSIESALGVAHMAEIARASSRVISLNLGPEDFTRDIGVEPSVEGSEQAYAKGMVVIAARLAGVQPHGLTSTLADYSDLEAMRRSVIHAAQLGFKGASCIHPAQVPILNEHFSPDPARVDHARRVVEVFSEAEAAGRASVSLDGRMVDIPVVERARVVLERAKAIQAWEERKQAALDRQGG